MTAVARSAEVEMIEGGTPTIYVSNMDRAVEFYTEVLGLGLISRYGNEWASVDVGKGLTLVKMASSSR